MQKKSVHSCFFVTPIGGEATPQRKRADDLLAHLLRPISKDFLEIVRADEVDEPGTITTDIVRRLHTADLVIADLTGQNPNVMYEIGLRHCFNLPIVHLAQSGERPPFDLSAERIIFFDIGDIASVEAAKVKIKKACQAALEAKPFRSPVVRALELESLFAAVGELPMPRDLIEKLDQLESKLDDVSGDLSSLSFAIDSGISISVDHMNLAALDRINELMRLFDRVGPSDIARLADELRRK
ncbi:MAG: hypothetical protein ACLFU2_13495 [Opitutales bacterium]